MAALFDIEERRRKLVRRYIPPKKWIDSLCSKGNELHEDFQTETIKTVDSLLVTLCEGNLVAKTMLRHILAWLPYASRKDGFIWRSAPEWQQMEGLTTGQVYNSDNRAKLRKIGIVEKKFKVNGSPVLHFGLDAYKFTAAIAKAINWSVVSLKTKLWSLFTQAVSSFRKPQSSESKKPLTDSTTIKTTKTNNSESVDMTPSSLNLLKSTKLLSANECKRYAALSCETIQACIDSLETATIKTSRRAYFRSALKNQIEEQAEKTHKQSWIEDILANNDRDDTKTDTPVFSADIIKKNFAVIDTPPGINQSEIYDPVWNMAYNQLELQFDKHTFLQYLKPTKFLSRDGNNYVVGVETAHQQDMLQHRLYRNIRRVLADVLLKPADEVKIRFEIQKGI